MILTMAFDPEEIKDSEHWLIKSMWKFLQEDWIELKHEELKEINATNLQEVMDLIIKYYVFSHSPNKK